MANSNVTILNIIERIFSNWTGLRMAVEHGMGTKAHAYSFCHYVEEILSMNENLDATDFAAELEFIMDSEFNTQLEDDSEKYVAQDIIRFQQLILQNDTQKLTSELERLPPLQPWIMPHTGPVTRSRSVVESDDSDCNEGDEIAKGNQSVPNSNQMEVDDGWTVVTRK